MSDEIEDIIYSALSFPTTEEEVTNMEKTLAETGYPELPDSLQSDDEILERLKSEITIISLTESSPPKLAKGFSRAARFGNELSAEIIAKMERDRNEHPKDEASD